MWNFQVSAHMEVLYGNLETVTVKEATKAIVQVVIYQNSFDNKTSNESKSFCCV
jgi:hypothetical protein